MFTLCQDVQMLAAEGCNFFTTTLLEADLIWPGLNQSLLIWNNLKHCRRKSSTIINGEFKHFVEKPSNSSSWSWNVLATPKEDEPFKWYKKLIETKIVLQPASNENMCMINDQCQPVLHDWANKYYGIAVSGGYMYPWRAGKRGGRFVPIAAFA